MREGNVFTAACLLTGGGPVTGHGYPRTGVRTPLPPDSIGVPPPSRRASACYAAGGMSLVVTQEDSLPVLISLTKMMILLTLSHTIQELKKFIS